MKTTPVLLVCLLGSVAASLVGQPLFNQKSDWTFELSEGAVLGTKPAAAWQLNGVSASIVRRGAQNSEHALALSGAGWAILPLESKTGKIPPALYYTVIVRPNFGLTIEEASSIILGGATLGYRCSMVDARSMELVAMDGATGEWRPTRLFVGSGSQRHRSAYQALTVRVDRKSATWNLYFRGRLILADLGLAPGKDVPGIAIFSGKDGEMLVDDVSVSEYTPMFSDANANGIPDNLEQKHGVSGPSLSWTKTKLANGKTLWEEHVADLEQRAHRLEFSKDQPPAPKG